MMKLKNNLLIALVLISFFAFLACDDQKPQAKNSDTETMNSGKLTVYCDESLAEKLDSVVQWYKAANPKVEFTYKIDNSRAVMAKLLAGEARAIVIGRDYLKDEDSLMKVYKVQKHQSMEIASDALTFFANPDLNIDTLNHAQIVDALTSPNPNLKASLPKLNDEPLFVVPAANSSEYANIMSLVTKGKKLNSKVKILKDYKDVMEFVKNNKNAIGVGFLLNSIGSPYHKLISIGYNDSTGKYINPKPVHQAYILQNLYPYVVKYKVLLLEDRKNLPFWFAAHMSREARVTTYLKNIGIVPTYAKFVLIKED